MWGAAKSAGTFSNRGCVPRKHAWTVDELLVKCASEYGCLFSLGNFCQCVVG